MVGARPAPALQWTFTFPLRAASRSKLYRCLIVPIVLQCLSGSNGSQREGRNSTCGGGSPHSGFLRRCQTAGGSRLRCGRPSHPPNHVIRPFQTSVQTRWIPLNTPSRLPAHCSQRNNPPTAQLTISGTDHGVARSRGQGMGRAIGEIARWASILRPPYLEREAGCGKAALCVEHLRAFRGGEADLA
jgi:hypothetical protein